MIEIEEIERIMTREEQRFADSLLVHRAFRQVRDELQRRLAHRTLTPDLVELGRLLQARREALGVTQDDVAQRAGIHRVHVSRVELATRSKEAPARPRRATLRCWTEALGMNRGETAQVMRAAGYEP